MVDLIKRNRVLGIIGESILSAALSAYLAEGFVACTQLNSVIFSRAPYLEHLSTVKIYILLLGSLFESFMVG